MTNHVAVTGIVVTPPQKNEEGRYTKKSIVTILIANISKDCSPEDDDFPLYQSEYLKVNVSLSDVYGIKNISNAMQAGILVNVVGSLSIINMPNGNKVLGIKAKGIEFLTRRKIDTDFDPLKWISLYNDKQLNSKYRRVRKEMKSLKDGG